MVLVEFAVQPTDVLIQGSIRSSVETVPFLACIISNAVERARRVAQVPDFLIDLLAGLEPVEARRDASSPTFHVHGYYYSTFSLLFLSFARSAGVHMKRSCRSEDLETYYSDWPVYMPTRNIRQNSAY